MSGVSTVKRKLKMVSDLEKMTLRMLFQAKVFSIALKRKATQVCIVGGAVGKQCLKV